MSEEKDGIEIENKDEIMDIITQPIVDESEKIRKEWDELRFNFYKTLAADDNRYLKQMEEFFKEKFGKGTPFRRTCKQILKGIEQTWDVVQPALVKFVKANLGLALRVVKDIAIEYVNSDGDFKRIMATERIKDALPDVNYSVNWLGLLVEIAVAILKGTDIL